MIIGKKLREQREQKDFLLRQLAAELKVDTAYISKIEQGKKNIYKVNPQELITIWLANQILEIVKKEDVAIEALNIASNNL